MGIFKIWNGTWKMYTSLISESMYTFSHKENNFIWASWKKNETVTSVATFFTLNYLGIYPLYSNMEVKHCPHFVLSVQQTQLCTKSNLDDMRLFTFSHLVCHDDIYKMTRLHNTCKHIACVFPSQSIYPNAFFYFCVPKETNNFLPL